MQGIGHLPGNIVSAQYSYGSSVQFIASKVKFMAETTGSVQEDLPGLCAGRSVLSERVDAGPDSDNVCDISIMNI